MTARFQGTTDDVVAAILWFQSFNPHMRRFVKVLRWLFLLSLVLAIAMSLLPRPADPTGMVIFVLGMGLLSWKLDAVVRWGARMKAKSGEDNSLFVGPVSVELNPACVRWETHSSKTEWVWSAVTRVADDRDHIMLLVGANNVMPIPHRAFSSVADRAAFLAEATRLWRESGANRPSA